MIRPLPLYYLVYNLFCISIVSVARCVLSLFVIISIKFYCLSISLCKTCKSCNSSIRSTDIHTDRKLYETFTFVLELFIADIVRCYYNILIAVSLIYTDVYKRQFRRWWVRRFSYHILQSDNHLSQAVFHKIKRAPLEQHAQFHQDFLTNVQ